jgi:hypothetical protein
MMVWDEFWAGVLQVSWTILKYIGYVVGTVVFIILNIIIIGSSS